MPENAPPVFPSLNMIRKKIPQHCFESNLGISLLYVVRNLAIAVGLFFVAWKYFPMLPTGLKEVAWLAYWFLQGANLMGTFVLGHDCGHESFSKYHKVNHLVGNILHSAILVPYWPWALSHRNHHQNTGHIDKDEPFTPWRQSRKPWKPLHDELKATVQRGLVGFFGLLWYPYLFGFSGRLKSHFWPWDPMFKNRFWQLMGSYFWLALASFGLGYSIYQFGIWDVTAYYLIPIFVFNSWLIVITFLHHNKKDVVWYGDEEWTYVKGNLSTVDNSYGWLLNSILHNIGTHQIHHIFPFIPHYKLKEATQHFRKAFPQFVRVSHDAILPAYLRNVRNHALYGYAEAGRQKFTYSDAIAERGPKSLKTVIRQEGRRKKVTSPSSS